MTNKEQIMIDGINVTNCNHIIAYDPPPEQGTWGGAIHKGACKIYSKDCKYNPDCDYKQLARKTQECEELRKKEFISNPVEAYENVVKQLARKTQECEELRKKEFISNPVEAYENVVKQLARKTQECEKLKEKNALLETQMAFNLSEMEIKLGNEINRSETLLKELKRFDKIKDEFREMSEKLKTENTHNRKALEEIEEYIKKDCGCEKKDCGCECIDCLEQWDCRFEDILDIINKAKGNK